MRGKDAVRLPRMSYRTGLVYFSVPSVVKFLHLRGASRFKEAVPKRARSVRSHLVLEQALKNERFYLLFLAVIHKV
jgi:hypothetical protein